MEILFTFKIKKHDELALIDEFPSASIHFDGSIDDKEVETADVIVTYGVNIDEAVLKRAKSLKWLMIASAGVEKMPLLEIAKRNILITNVRGIHKTPMAESVLAHILALKRSIPEIYAIQETKKWATKFNSTELRGSTALILGPGAIGSEIGRLLQAFGVKTIGCNRTGRSVDSMDEVISFNELLSNLPVADYVISVLPSTPETKGLLTAEHLEAMKDTAVFMNFGRGDLINEDVLVTALKNSVIGHAVLDVFEKEPLPESHEFWTLPNCTVSPHVSAKSGKYIERSLVVFKKNLKIWIENEEDFINVINPESGY
ncbi:D-2-hydroxyacid dehydrogenase [Sporosarcina sp. Marseille-Q4063]|uniref:D-2-hydroxyacid dehydrogenase n=1 Tax=Sporosarcina sp. Marseille-Q4063 TaxID=2810514 RepID=UPI001BB0CBFB|nr:D-2-hydroxyacid dehydrogenase [Sporosarcina sp. Marseille-Q4063]QUW23477.1 D-2-hydroxyacid dehydrogenase [Sporosarcina sp. Marseille-Q4063]